MHRCNLMSIILTLCIVVRIAGLMLNNWWNSLPMFLAEALYGIYKYAHRQPDHGTSLDGEPQKKPSQQYAGDVQTD